MVNTLKQIHQRIYILSVAFFFTLLYPAFYYYSRKPEHYKKLNKFRTLWSLGSSAFVGIFYKFHFQSEIDWSRPYILCPNHTSNLDVPAMTILAKGNFAFMGKDELLSNPLIGIFMRTVDIPLNRDSKISAYKAFKKAETCLQEGRSLIIFPEGKIPNDYPPVMHNFKNGPFRLAIEQQVPVIPVSIRSVWKIMWDDGKRYGSRPGICNICIHQPIETVGMDVRQADDLRDKVFDIISKGINED